MDSISVLREKLIQFGPIDRAGPFLWTELEIKFVENKLEFRIC
jgi:hypothetical protein